MIRPIVLWPDPVLARRCDPILEIDAAVRDLAQDMLETMYDAPGRGLAAPQVGVPLRLFVMDCTWKEAEPSPRVVINPEIETISDARAIGPEGCLSIPGVLADVERHEAITLRWTDLDGRTQQEVLTGFEAICAQHEYDHLDGVVTLDRLAPSDRARLEEAYTG